MDESYLMHHGIKGMKWGIRRYQNADGSLTSAGLKRYGQGERKFLKTAGQMRRDVRKMRRNMIKDTVKGTFSKKSDLRRRDVAPANFVLPGSGALIRLGDRFSKQGFKDAMSRNKQVAKNYKSHMENTYGDTYRKAKKRQIVKAATTGAALATIAGLSIAAGVKNAKNPNSSAYQNKQQKNANKNYKKQQSIIEGIKNNPNANNAGYAWKKRGNVKA